MGDNQMTKIGLIFSVVFVALVFSVTAGGNKKKDSKKTTEEAEVIQVNSEVHAEATSIYVSSNKKVMVVWQVGTNKNWYIQEKRNINNDWVDVVGPLSPDSRGNLNFLYSPGILMANSFRVIQKP
jgi:hypothetical protein